MKAKSPIEAEAGSLAIGVIASPIALPRGIRITTIQLPLPCMEVAQMNGSSGRVVLLANPISRHLLASPMRRVLGSDLMDAADASEVVQALPDAEVLIIPQYVYSGMIEAAVSQNPPKLRWI